jgi:hypothetical protein
MLLHDEHGYVRLNCLPLINLNFGVYLVMLVELIFREVYLEILVEDSDGAHLKLNDC